LAFFSVPKLGYTDEVQVSGPTALRRKDTPSRKTTPFAAHASYSGMKKHDKTRTSVKIPASKLWTPETIKLQIVKTNTSIDTPRLTRRIPTKVLIRRRQHSAHEKKLRSFVKAKICQTVNVFGW
jgi:hypothetical protein